MQNLEWYLAYLKSTIEKSLPDMFIRLVRIYPCLILPLPQSESGRKKFPTDRINNEKIQISQFSNLNTRVICQENGLSKFHKDHIHIGDCTAHTLNCMKVQ